MSSNYTFKNKVTNYSLIYIYVCVCIYFKIRRSMKRFVFFELIHFVLTYMLYIYMYVSSL